MQRIITISGSPGSGKSSTAKGVAEALGYKHYSTGDLFRTMAKERGISIEEINQTAELKEELDFALDERLRTISQDTNLVIDSRIAWHWIPDSFKVLLVIDPHLAAKRTFAQLQAQGRASQTASSVDEVYEHTSQRIASETKRFANLYNINYADESNYDLVINTAEHPLPEVVSMVVEAYKQSRGL